MYQFLLRKVTLVTFCKQLRQDGHLTAGACGSTTWNETVQNLSGAYVSREGQRIVAMSEDAEAESESDSEAGGGDAGGHRLTSRSGSVFLLWL